MNSLISATDVNVSKSGKTILKDVSIKINKNDFITIIGPNGAGKSMLLKCIMGFYQPNSGIIKIKPNLKLGYMPQNLDIIKTIPIKVQKFITLKKKFDKISLQKVILETQIENILDKQLTILSGGEMQRVLLARSLLNNPDVLILDEPAQNLDISGQMHFYKLLQKIYSKRELSILMVSHDLHLVMVSTKQVICLSNHVCCCGKPQQIANDPEFLTMFGKDMAEVMAVYQHANKENSKNINNSLGENHY